MCSLAPHAAAPGFGAAAAFLDRRRGVAAAAPATRRVGAEMATAPSLKRGRDVADAASSSALRVRMDKELVALQGLLKRAKLLPRSAPPAEKKYASSAAKSTATEASHHQTQMTVPLPAANSKQQQQQQRRPVQGAAAKTMQVPKTAREGFRRMLLEMERSVLPDDEMIYPEELEELGIKFQHVVTRTRKQAWLEDHGKKVVPVGA